MDGPAGTDATGSDARAATADEAVLHPGSNDIMFGRGGDTNYHVGNNRFRTLIAEKYRWRYQQAKSRKERSMIAIEVIQQWREGQDPPGRFLAKQEGNGTWYEVSHDVAFRKAMKVLGEKTTKAQKAKQEQQLLLQLQQRSHATVQLQQLKHSQELQQSVLPEPQPDSSSMLALSHQAVTQKQPYEQMVARFQQTVVQKQQALPRGAVVPVPTAHAQHPLQAQAVAPNMEKFVKDQFYVRQEQEQQKHRQPAMVASVQHEQAQPFRASAAADGTLAQHLRQEQARNNGALQSLALAPAACTLRLIQGHPPAWRLQEDGRSRAAAIKPDTQAITAATEKEAQRQSAPPKKLPSAAKLTTVFEKDFVSSGSSEEENLV